MPELQTLTTNERFQDLSADAKRIVIDRLSREDPVFQKLSPDAQKIVTQRLMQPPPSFVPVPEAGAAELFTEPGPIPAGTIPALPRPVPEAGMAEVFLEPPVTAVGRISGEALQAPVSLVEQSILFDFPPFKLPPPRPGQSDVSYKAELAVWTPVLLAIGGFDLGMRLLFAPVVALVTAGKQGLVELGVSQKDADSLERDLFTGLLVRWGLMPRAPVGARIAPIRGRFEATRNLRVKLEAASTPEGMQALLDEVFAVENKLSKVKEIRAKLAKQSPEKAAAFEEAFRFRATQGFAEGQRNIQQAARGEPTIEPPTGQVPAVRAQEALPTPTPVAQVPPGEAIAPKPTPRPPISPTKIVQPPPPPLPEVPPAPPPIKAAQVRTVAGSTLKHFTTRESKAALEAGDPFDPKRLPQHGTGARDRGPKIERFAGPNRIYLSLDDPTWSEAFRDKGVGEVVEAFQQPDSVMQDPKNLTYYDYDKQKWMVAIGAQERTPLVPVEFIISRDARVLTIDSLEALQQATNQVRTLSGKRLLWDQHEFWDALALRYDAVEIVNVKRAINLTDNKFFKAAHGDQVIVLNKEVATVVRPPPAPAQAEAFPIEREIPRGKIRPEVDLGAEGTPLFEPPPAEQITIEEAQAFERGAVAEVRTEMGAGLVAFIKEQGGIRPTGTSPSVVKEISQRQPGIMRKAASMAMDQMAEFLRREHPRFGVETTAGLEEALRSRLPGREPAVVEGRIPQAESPAHPLYRPPVTVEGKRIVDSKRDLVLKLQDAAGVPIRVGRFRKGGALGIWKRKPQVIRIKSAADITTAAHEVGHFLHDEKVIDTKGFGESLKELGKQFKGNPLREGVAEFVSLYVSDPTLANSAVPGFMVRFESKLEQEWPEILASLQDIRELLKKFRESPLEARVATTIAQRERGSHLTLKTFRQWATRLYAGVFDDTHFIKKIEEAAFQGRPIPADQSPYILARLTRGVSGVGDVFVQDGPIDWKTLTVSKKIPGLLKIIEPIWKQRTDFETYVVLRRARELLNSDVRRLQQAGRRLTEMWETKPLEIEGAILRLQKNEGFREAADMIQKWNDALLDYVAASGRYSPEVIETIKRFHRNYVPLYRIFEELPDNLTGPPIAGERLADLPSPIKLLKGSTRNIESPIESLIRNAYAMTTVANKNEVSALMATLAEQTKGLGVWMEKLPVRIKPTMFQLAEIKSTLQDAGFDVENAELETLATVFRPMRVPERNVITIYRKGTPELWQVDPAIYRAMLNLERFTLPAWAKFLRLPARVFRLGVTLTPEFQMRNMIRDQMTAMIQGRAIPFAGFVQGLFEQMGRGEDFIRWKASGGAIFGNLALDTDALANRLERVMKQKGLKDFIDPRNPAQIGRSLLEVLASATELSESPTRIGVFKREMRKPRPEDITERAKVLRAAFESREASLDFGRRGGGILAWTQTTAFMNPWLQGLDKVARVIKNNPGKSSAFAATMILTTYYLYQHNKKQPAYDSVPGWKKDTGWVYCPEGGGACKWLPGAFEWHIIFSAIPRRIFEWMDEDNPEAFDKLLETTTRGVGNNVIPTIFQPWIENFGNYDPFFERPIIPRGLEEVTPAEQFTPHTSELAKRIGRMLEYPPAKIDNLIQGYTGGLGRTVVQGLDGLLREEDIGERPEGGITTWPGVRVFFIRVPSLSGEVVQDFFRFRERAREAVLTRNRMIKEGRDHAAFDIEHAWEIAIHSTFEKQARRFSTLRKGLLKIDRDPNLTGDQKRKAIDQITLWMIQQSKEKVEAAKELKKFLDEQRDILFQRLGGG